MKKILFALFPVLLVLFLSVPIIRPLFSVGFFPMHDDTQVARVYEMGKALQDGMFPVRWVNDLGYGFGYPIFTFYAPLAYYVGGFINVFGTDPLLATKIMMGIGMVLAGIFMYLFCNEVFGKEAGVIGGLFYTFATYHAVDLYVRGDIAELFAYAFVPLAAYGMLLSSRKKNLMSVFVGSLGFAGVIISHNLTAFMTSPFLFLFACILAVLSWRSKHSVKQLLFAFYPLAGGILFAAFYWLPVFSEMKYTNVLSQIGGGADFRNHFVCLSQLWYSPWGYGGSVAGCTDGLSFMIGKLHIIAVAISILVAIFLFKNKKSTAWWMAGGLVGFIFSIFLMTSFSKNVWEAFSFMSFLQYPWRYLLLASFFSSFLAAGMIGIVSGKFVKLGSVCVLVVILLFLQSKFFVPQKILGVTSANYVSPSIIRWTTSRISDEYMPKNFQKPILQSNIPVASFTAFHGEKGLLFVVQDKTQKKEVVVDSQTPAQVEAYIAYFPAWKMFVDGVALPYSVEKDGLSVLVGPGRHTVTAEYRSTSVETVGNWITLTSVLLLVLGIIYERSKQAYGKKIA